jgi:SAM-dependent methyltransferase
MHPIITALTHNFERHYANLMQTHQEQSKQMGFRDQSAQFVRFAQLLRLTFDWKQQFSINDLGCGAGDLYSFLKGQNLHFHYSGYDMLPLMVLEAEKRFQKEEQARFFHLAHTSDMEPADIVFASGIFNLKYDAPDVGWQDYIEKTLVEMFKKSNKALVFNALTTYSDPHKQATELHYSNPLELFHFCKTNLASNVVLYHDYGHYDFTIAVTKD